LLSLVEHASLVHMDAKCLAPAASPWTSGPPERRADQALSDACAQCMRVEMRARSSSFFGSRPSSFDAT